MLNLCGVVVISWRSLDDGGNSLTACPVEFQVLNPKLRIFWRVIIAADDVFFWRQHTMSLQKCHRLVHRVRQKLVWQDLVFCGLFPWFLRAFPALLWRVGLASSARRSVDLVLVTPGLYFAADVRVRLSCIVIIIGLLQLANYTCPVLYKKATFGFC